MELGALNSTSMSVTDSALFTDLGSLAKLRHKAEDDSQGALKEVAQQFESLFVQMMMKSMRDATEGGGLYDGNMFNSDEMKFHQSMFDQQLSLHLSQSGGIGLANIIERQLGGDRLNGTPVDAAKPIDQSWLQTAQRVAVMQRAEPPRQSQPYLQPLVAANDSSSDSKAITQAADFTPDSPEEFIDRIWPHAKRAAQTLGVDADVLVAQAALESGWGQKMIRHADGRNSFNLFGIKADSRWQGDRAQVSTIEFRGGVAQRELASFRAYESLAESFDDYAAFVRQPRYQGALAVAADSGAYLQALQDAGYATDPEYASKINRIINRDEFQAQVADLKGRQFASAI